MIEYLKYNIVHDPKKLIIYLIIISISFICIGHKYRHNIQSKLKKKLYVIPSFTIDYWSISHFIL